MRANGENDMLEEIDDQVEVNKDISVEVDGGGNGGYNLQLGELEPFWQFKQWDQPERAKYIKRGKAGKMESRKNTRKPHLDKWRSKGNGLGENPSPKSTTRNKYRHEQNKKGYKSLRNKKGHDNKAKMQNGTDKKQRKNT